MDCKSGLRNRQIVEAFAESLDESKKGQSFEDDVGHMRIHVHLHSEDDVKILPTLAIGVLLTL